MTQLASNFLVLALDDYRAARLLLRQGLLAQGTAVAATAVEKELKAALAMKGVFNKRHLDASLLTLAARHYPGLDAVIKPDFIRFLGKAFKLRYAAVDGAGFGIVINQYRTLMELDTTVLTLDSGFSITRNGVPFVSPLRKAIENKDPLILSDNLRLGQVKWEEFANRPNKMLEMRIGAKLRTLSVAYETEGLNIIGEFCKNTEVDFGKQEFAMALG